MAISVEALSRILGSVYEAALDETGATWSDALADISVAVTARGPAILAMERQRFDYVRTYALRTDEIAVARHHEYYARLDPALEPALTHAPIGQVLVTDALIPTRELVRTEFYNDWLRVLGVHSCAAAVVHRDQGSGVALYLTRERVAGPFANEDLALLSLLMPHVQRAAATALRLAAAHSANDTLTGALDRVGDAVLVVDRDGHVLVTNRAADRLLAEGDGLSVDRRGPQGVGGLRASRAADTLELRRLIAEAAAWAHLQHGRRITVDATRGGGTLVLKRPSGRPALYAIVSPVPAASERPPNTFVELTRPCQGGAAIVLIRNPGAAPAGTDRGLLNYLQATYQLTETEAAVAVQVCTGGGLAAVARERDVSLATVRTQVQRVYQKTGARGQVELAGLVDRLRVGRT